MQTMVEQMTRAIKHRGPDDDGTHVLAAADIWRVGLGNTRLSILDLSPAGHQPMRDPDTGNWIVYNGEVYNFRQVRAELESKGCRFETQCDTEVILKGYATLGVECLSRLCGMFAFAIWDVGKQSLFLSRDRLGVKPLYYCQARDSLLFASEVRALLASGAVPRRLSLQGVDSYLALGAVQDPLTLVQNVYALPAGHYAWWHDGALTTHSYWSLPLHVDPDRARQPRERIVAELRGILEDSVRLRQVSDVPVGAFLSGGVDSSAIVSLMSRTSSTPPHTVSIVFPEQEFSEAEFMHIIARHYGTQHTEIMLSVGDLLACLPEALSAMDQPTFDGINTYIVSKHTRQTGLKVAVSGVGGDELFGGYESSFVRLGQLQNLQKWMPGVIGRVAGNGMNAALRDNDRGRKLRRWFQQRNLTLDAYLLVRELFGNDDRRRLFPALASIPKTGRSFEEGQPDDEFNQVSAWELSHYMRNVLLRDTDCMSMAWGLEVREPLLDHRLVEFMMTLPGSFKREGKRLFKDAVGDLPIEIRKRRKQGFVLPFAPWMRGTLRAQVESVLLDGAGDDRLPLDRAQVQRVWERFLGGQGQWVRPWALYVLREWCNLNLWDKFSGRDHAYSSPDRQFVS